MLRLCSNRLMTRGRDNVGDGLVAYGPELADACVFFSFIYLLQLCKQSAVCLSSMLSPPPSVHQPCFLHPFDSVDGQRPNTSSSPSEGGEWHTQFQGGGSTAEMVFETFSRIRYRSSGDELLQYVAAWFPSLPVRLSISRSSRSSQVDSNQTF